ncbi:hypothetical protein, partial [Pseudomonas aeruginosa]
CFFVQSMPRASKQQARYAVGRCLMLWSSNDVTQQGSRPKTKLDALLCAQISASNKTVFFLKSNLKFLRGTPWRNILKNWLFLA